VPVARGCFGFGGLYLNINTHAWFVYAKSEKYDTKGFGPKGELYGEMLTMWANTLATHFNAPFTYRPLNDVEIRGYKVGGYGGFEIGDSTTFYGFVQIGPGPTAEQVNRYLKTPPGKLADKAIETVGLRGTCFEDAVGRKINPHEVKELLKKRLEEKFNMTLVPAELTDEERQEIVESYKSDMSEDWILANTDEVKFGTIPPDADVRRYAMKVPGGPNIHVVALVKEDTIQDISITGSIHCTPRDFPLEIERAVKGARIDEKVIKQRIDEVFTRGSVGMGTAEDFTKAVMGAVSKTGPDKAIW
jgi:lipoate-protein ligase A